MTITSQMTTNSLRADTLSFGEDRLGPIYDRIATKLQEEKYSLDGAANGRRSRAQNDSFLVPHEEVPGSNPGQGKQLVFFKVLYG